jgi:RimJ/RimL family protein N-acetyltransferase
METKKYDGMGEYSQDDNQKVSVEKSPINFGYRYMRTPPWAGDEDIYFMVTIDNNEIGYIGLQELNFKTGVCGNLCYKTRESYRKQGLTKEYVKMFITKACPFNFVAIYAKVFNSNVASQKILDYSNFRESADKLGKREYQLRLMDY